MNACETSITQAFRQIDASDLGADYGRDGDDVDVVVSEDVARRVLGALAPIDLGELLRLRFADAHEARDAGAHLVPVQLELFGVLRE